MTLGELIGRLEFLDQAGSIYVAGPWSRDARACVFREPENDLGPWPDTMGMDYMLDVDVALEAAKASELGSRLERVFHFAAHGVHLGEPVEPDPDDDTRWYVPDGWDPNGVTRTETDDRRPLDRDAVIRLAREERAEGRATDDATLQRVADRFFSGADFTMEFVTPEEAEDFIEDPVLAAMREHQRRRPERSGGSWVGWHQGRRAVFVGIAAEFDEADLDLASRFAPRIVLRSVPRSERELEQLVDRIGGEISTLWDAHGYFVLTVHEDPVTGNIEVEVAGGERAEDARSFFADRYGAHVIADWVGPSPDRETPTPFGSWSSDGKTLTVYYGLGCNGDRLGTVEVVEESADRIVVALTRLEYQGPTTLVGGFQSHQARLRLAAPVDGREIIDAADRQPRPERPDPS